MKKKLLCIFMIVHSFVCYSQSDSSNIEPKPKEGSIAEIDGLTDDQFNEVMRNNFQQITNSNGKNSIGNYAATEIKEGRLTFNATKNFTNGNLLSFNATGGITDGFFAIFNETKVNSNIGLDMKFTVLARNGSSLSYDTRERNRLFHEIDLIKYKRGKASSFRKLDSLLLRNELTLINADLEELGHRLQNNKFGELEKAKVEYELAHKDLERDSVNAKLGRLFLDDATRLQDERVANLLKKELLVIKEDSMELAYRLRNEKFGQIDRAKTEHQLALMSLQRDSVLYKLEMLVSEEVTVKDAAKKAKKEMKAAAESFELTAFHVHWFSFGAGLQNNNFNLFKPTYSTLDSQIVKQNYTTWNLSVEYNLYNWNDLSKYSYFLSVGAKLMIDDNFSDLKKAELSDVYQFSKDTTVERTETKKTVVYKGDYKTKLLGAKMYVDFYKFLWENSAAIHISPEVNFKEHGKRLFNAGIGLLYSFKDAKDKEEKAKVNVEAFFKLNDLSDNAEAKNSIWERNEFGLRISIPVTFFKF